jgi:2-polyprenyl-3-methyl-5-hydroxy-6-metoxy-1,4-benzoquinol methylase
MEKAVRRLFWELTPPVVVKSLKKLRRQFQENSSQSAKAAKQISHTAACKYIDTIEELDKEIKRAEEAAEVSDDELRKVLASFHYVLDYDLPDDPYSPQYAEAVMKVYREISGISNYNSYKNEISPFNFTQARISPFPYSTNSASTVGDQLIAQGFLIKMMNLPANSTILEYGPGWGNTTLHFAQMGYRVTAVDVEKSFIDLIAYRAERLGQTITLFQEDMLSFIPSHKFNAVVFFECFHHCSDHLRMLEKLDSMVAEGGKIVFAGEPLADFPFPWGIRLDGISVWSIRKYGWLELGFNTSYFLKTLEKYGWKAHKFTSLDCPWQSVVVAQRA